MRKPERLTEGSVCGTPLYAMVRGMTTEQPRLAGTRLAGVSVRRARPDDAGRMTELARRAYEPYVPRIGREPAPMGEDYFALAQQEGVWLAEQNDGLVGLLVLVPTDDHMLVQNVAVAPEAQGLGVGGLLLQVAEEQTRVLGLMELRLYTHEAMTENLDYYPRRGYQETHRARQLGYARVFFSKRLTD